MNIKNFLVVALVSLAACGGPVSVEQASSKKVSSTRAAFKVIEDVGVQQVVTPQDISGERVSGFNTKLFNMGFTSTKAKLVSHVSIDLGNSPAAQKIKESGEPVYAYLKPRYVVFRQNAGSDRINRRERRMLLKDGVGSLCYGYYVILNPENGYKRSWTVNGEIELASKTTGMDAGLWGSNLGAENWRLDDIEKRTETRTKASKRTFLYENGSRLFNNCYADRKTLEAWRRAK